MYRFFVPAVAAALSLALTSGPAHARGRSGGPSYSAPHNYARSFSTYSNHHFTSINSYVSKYGVNSYVSKYGTKFSHGYYFNARNFYWNSRYWSSRYGCYCYWSPYVNSWYYWCAPQSCYYPISYITVVPPTVTVTPPTVAVTPATVAVTPATVAVSTPVSGGPAGPGVMPPAGPPAP
ncbi:MAG TPA: hypothetical protein VH575_07045 [Gemmataceae bacterium]|jgi:hypothetical protein